MVIIENKCKFSVILLSEGKELIIPPKSTFPINFPEGITQVSFVHKKNSYYRHGTYHMMITANISFPSTSSTETITVHEFKKYNGIANILNAFEFTSSIEELSCSYYVANEALLQRKYKKNKQRKKIRNVLIELFIAFSSAAVFYPILKYYIPNYRYIIFLSLIVLFSIISVLTEMLVTHFLNRTFLRRPKNKDENDFYNCFHPDYLKQRILQSNQSGDSFPRPQTG